MTKRDYYDILGIARNATPELIRAAHRVQSRRYHPDTADDGKGDAVLFAEIQEAYETLSNPDNRRRYDTKEGFGRGEYSAGGKRRPPKTPCGACGEPVYASQLRLYLGRHICRDCMDRKHEREMARPRLTGINETLWKLKRVRLWAQQHFALLTVFVLAAIAVGARLVSVGNHKPRPDRMLDESFMTTTTSEATPPSAPQSAPVTNPCLVPPPPLPPNADLSSSRTSDKP